MRCAVTATVFSDLDPALLCVFDGDRVRVGTKLSALRSLLPKHANDNARMIVVGSQRPISSPTLSFQDVHPFEFSWLSPKQRRLLRISNMYISRSPNAERDATDGRTQTRSKRRKTRHITRCSQKDKCPRRTSGGHGTTLASGAPLFKGIRPDGSASVGVRMRPIQRRVPARHLVATYPPLPFVNQLA